MPKRGSRIALTISLLKPSLKDVLDVKFTISLTLVVIVGKDFELSMLLTMHSEIELGYCSTQYVAAGKAMAGRTRLSHRSDPLRVRLGKGNESRGEVVWGDLPSAVQGSSSISCQIKNGDMLHS